MSPVLDEIVEKIKGLTSGSKMTIMATSSEEQRQMVVMMKTSAQKAISPYDFTSPLWGVAKQCNNPPGSDFAFTYNIIAHDEAWHCYYKMLGNLDEIPNFDKYGFIGDMFLASSLMGGEI